MALSIRNRETQRLADELARIAGETKTEAVTRALRERLERVRRDRTRRSLADELDVIAKRCAARPVLDGRDEEEVLGFDASGIPAVRW
jgi:antitoxin VapB